jgi:hypothetical protein
MFIRWTYTWAYVLTTEYDSNNISRSSYKHGPYRYIYIRWSVQTH